MLIVLKEHNILLARIIFFCTDVTARHSEIIGALQDNGQIIPYKSNITPYGPFYYVVFKSIDI